jgi:hypothetical protein
MEQPILESQSSRELLLDDPHGEDHMGNLRGDLRTREQNHWIATCGKVVVIEVTSTLTS